MPNKRPNSNLVPLTRSPFFSPRRPLPSFPLQEKTAFDISMTAPFIGFAKKNLAGRSTTRKRGVRFDYRCPLPRGASSRDGERNEGRLRWAASRDLSRFVTPYREGARPMRNCLCSCVPPCRTRTPKPRGDDRPLFLSANRVINGRARAPGVGSSTMTKPPAGRLDASPLERAREGFRNGR